MRLNVEFAPELDGSAASAGYGSQDRAVSKRACCRPPNHGRGIKSENTPKFHEKDIVFYEFI
jgi:hypothetical protein